MEKNIKLKYNKSMYFLFLIILFQSAKIYKKGHNLKNFDQIKLKMTKKEVQEILGQELSFNEIENVSYYISQDVDMKIMIFSKTYNQKIVRLKFNDENEVIKIDIIDFQKYKPNPKKHDTPKALKNINFQLNLKNS